MTEMRCNRGRKGRNGKSVHMGVIGGEMPDYAVYSYALSCPVLF